MWSRRRCFAVTGGAGDEGSPKIDTTVPHSARIWNYWLGGKDNYPVDRQAGEQTIAVLPDTGGGYLSARGVASATATVITGGGDGWLAFSAAPDTVTLSTDGGAAELVVPGGPYALTTDSDGGPYSVGIATDPAARRSITVASGGGPLEIRPGQLPARPAKPA
jgi:hypothetical protein